MLSDVIETQTPGRSAPGTPNDTVYAIGASWSTPVQIGVTTDPDTRRTAMQADSPVPLTVLWSAPGNRWTRDYLHRTLAVYRVHGDWFDLSLLTLPTGMLDALSHRAATERQWAENRLGTEALADYRRDLLAEIAQIEKTLRPAVVEAVRSGGMSRRSAARTFGLSRETVKAWVTAAAQEETTRLRKDRIALVRGLPATRGTGKTPASPHNQ